MTIARTDVALVGTNWTTGVSIATTATTTGSEVDLLGDTSSQGWIDLFLVYTFPNSAPTAGGTIDVTLQLAYGTGNEVDVALSAVVYSDPAVQNTTHKIYVGRFAVTRYVTGSIKNNATGQTITNAALLAELIKQS